MERAVLTERGKVEMKEMQKCLINWYISCDIQWTAAQSRTNVDDRVRACVCAGVRACVCVSGQRKTPACAIVSESPRKRTLSSKSDCSLPWLAISLHQYYFNALAMGYLVRGNTSKLQCPNIKEALTHSFQWGQFADTVRPLLHRASAEVHRGSQRMVLI